MEENLRYAIRLNPDLALFNITTPYPGTEMFKWADDNHYLLTKNWEDYDLSQPVMELPTVSAAKVMEYYRKSHRRFFFRPSYIYSRLKKVRSLEDLSSISRGIRIFLGI